MSGWTRRVRRPATPPNLHEVRAAAENLAEQAGMARGKRQLVFQTVADVVLLGTVVISGALAAVHLYRALFPRHKEDHHGPEPAGGGHLPPRRRGPRASATADHHGEHEEDGYRSR
jgi:hypothetical protein